jgi:uracil-DNA glycosylase family 4
VTVADDQIYERYQAKAIDEINALGHDIAEWLGDRHPGAAPVLGTGHPLADIVLVKHRPMPAEVQEGVAFFGRAGQAILKSLQRMRIDPLMLYGTTCTKADVEPRGEDLEQMRAFLVRELHITQPRIVVTLGDEGQAFLDSLSFPLAAACDGPVGEIRRFTPTIETLAVPDIDRCLDDAASKQAFWDAFKVLGSWYENLPPY